MNDQRGTETSERYLGEEGAAYHEIYREIFGLRVESSLRVLNPHLRPGDAILDFGCADGSLLAALPNLDKSGIEVNGASREVATGRGLTVYESADSVEDGSLDVVFSSHVLEHTLRPLDELAALRPKLRPGGKLILLLPIDDWRVQRRWILPEHNHHLYTWTPQLLANLLSEAGYEVESMDLLTYALPGRFSGRLHRLLPRGAFDLVARLTAVIRRRRQLIGVARTP